MSLRGVHEIKKKHSLGEEEEEPQQTHTQAGKQTQTNTHAFMRCDKIVSLHWNFALIVCFICELISLGCPFTLVNCTNCSESYQKGKMQRHFIVDLIIYSN